MLRWLMLLVLTVASATAWAQSVNGSLMDATTRAWNASVVAEQALGRTTAKWNDLNARWRVELDEVTKLKNAPQSWRRNNALRSKLSDADALGKQLAAATGEVQTATRDLATARRAVVAAIDAEIATNPGAPRRAQLDKARARVMPQGPKAHRIVLPDMQIDPLADPEELDQQAVSIRDTEAELGNQIKGLESQAKELDRVAMLRKQHERTKELDQRDDNSARKGGTPNGGRAGDTAAAPEANPTDGGAGGGPAAVSSFESDAKITLADVVDPNTIQELDRAQRSNDPSKRAAVARLTRDAVAKKLAQLRDKRKQVEDRAAQLRKR